ncbi:hypothetical protein, partial [uncultured Ruminococcus sp.]|uniref:hypothetical protein n=1 Tax=uncultured Ruminococcus sp. TaxID=165186 RepID=UPI00266CB291
LISGIFSSNGSHLLTTQMLILSKFQKKLDFPLVLWYDRNNALQAETFSCRKTAEKAGTFPVERNEHGEKAIL